MSAEKASSKNYYLRNRTRVFTIYGIDPKNQEYNCHHIVTRSDLKEGNIDLDFDIDGISNLYPIRKKTHIILHRIIDAADNGKDYQPLITRCREIETNSEDTSKENLKKSKNNTRTNLIDYNKIISIPINKRFNQQSEATNFADKLSKKDFDKLMAYRTRYEKNQLEELKEFQICCEAV